MTVSILIGTLAASVITSDSSPTASLYVVPELPSVGVGETITFTIMAESNVPVNTFVGELVFDTDYFFVTNISYNTSIANLWVEEPWYNRDKNTIYFAGGTTQAGGFSGVGELVQVTMQAKAAGDAALQLRNVRVLAHDGLGSDVELTKPLDTLISVDTTPFAIPLQEAPMERVVIVADAPPLDVNGDGKLSFQDTGVLLFALGSTNPKYDFNGDGSVTWADIRTWQQLRKMTNE